MVCFNLFLLDGLICDDDDDNVTMTLLYCGASYQTGQAPGIFSLFPKP